MIKTPVRFDEHLLLDANERRFHEDDAMGREAVRRINAHDALVAALKYIEEWTHVDPAKSSAPEDAYTDALAEIRKIAERAVRVPETLDWLLDRKLAKGE